MDETLAEEFFLLIDFNSESVTSKLSTSGVYWHGKRLESSWRNWREIARLASLPQCAGVVARLRARTYERLLDPAGGSHPRGLLMAIAAKPHLVLVHEAVLRGAAMHDHAAESGQEAPLVEAQDSSIDGMFKHRAPSPALPSDWEDSADGDTEEDWDDDWDDGSWNERTAREYFGDIEESVRLGANALLSELGIEATPYRRNAEASVLATSFLDDQTSNLIFRVYIPASRLFENEAAELLRMFHDWLTDVRGANVRQGGYATGRGRVIEFFAETRAASEQLQGEVERFQGFLDVVDRPEQAALILIGLGIEASEATALVSRYAIKARRLALDVKHERERVGLQIRQELESELTDVAPQVPAQALADLVEHFLPNAPTFGSIPAIEAASTLPGMVVNQQIIGTVQGVVAQHVAGDIVQGVEAGEIQKLIAEHGAAEREVLLDALRQLVDTSAPKPGRITARQKLKAFLVKVGDKVGSAGINVLQKWVEQQLGL